jgi:hypothetical protein
MSLSSGVSLQCERAPRACVGARFIVGEFMCLLCERVYRHAGGSVALYADSELLGYVCSGCEREEIAP